MNVELRHTNPVEDVYHITDGCGNFATLVVGQCKALLYDTMMGLGDLRSYVEGITNLPLVVMNSHCHLDHMGGNDQYDKVYCSFKDVELIDANIVNTYEREESQPFDLSLCRKGLEKKEILENIDEGAVFDLGGITAEVVGLPGHTEGSLGVYIPERRLLIVGDAISPQMCLFLEGGLFLKDYIATLEKVNEMDFDYFLLSHFEAPYPKEVLDDFMECTKLPSKKRGYDYEYSLIPKYKGMIYVYQARNALINDMVCIILRYDDEAINVEIQNAKKKKKTAQ